ncbi:MAG: flagellar biosynthesis protein FlhA [Proteobacteria bacterium]|nr:flagellar biosynthesis protein FlhA [Pseudomonadota bacterium]NOG58951.1 flagellar biosynthesis protein FlhA [Pseudomonadota bacterium]
MSLKISDWSRMGLGAPLLLMAILAMMVIPLPPFLLDIFFTFNIALSLIVLLAVVYSLRPLEFAVFPTVILIATLLRLSLNVASTRVVLLNGHAGPDAAGKVIESFGDFVVGGNYTVGFVVFTILVVINFVVVTKGAGRISEVTARFTLDAMPGKQMAIDADLNAGLIDQEEAKTRRAEVAQEADFYGAMDGASKFVRGDAIAGILILFINILGGLAIGIVQHDLAMADAARIYTLLTIGDGLVAQIPSLFLSTAAAIIVTRVSSASDMGQQIIFQLFRTPKTLYITASVLGLIGIIPGMPNVAFLFFAIVTAGLAYWMGEKKAQLEVEQQEIAPEPVALPAEEERELGWDDVESIDQIGLEVGYRLIPMVDRKQGGQLLSRVKGVRKKLTQELGFLLPAVHIRDNLDLEPNSYRIVIKDATIAKASVQVDAELAINPGQVFGELPGNTATDPVFGLEAVWIDPTQRDQAQTYGYTVVDPSTVVATHMSQILQEHAHELLGYKEVQSLIDRYNENSPKVIDDIIPNIIPVSIVLKVMQNLLRENIPIRDIRTIIETIIEYSRTTQSTDALTAAVRVALGRLIIERISSGDDELPVITLDMALEQLLQQTLQAMSEGTGAVEPGLAQRLISSLREACEKQELAGQPSVLLVADNLRELLVRLVRSSVPRLNILAFSEVPESKNIRIVNSVGSV